MATGGGSGDSAGRSHRDHDDHVDDESGFNNSRDLSDNTKQTLDLVDLFKDSLGVKIERKQTITEEDVEFATSEARKKLNPVDYSAEKWKNDSALNIDDSSNESFYLSMAYAKTPKQVKPIFQAKQEQLKDKKPTGTWLKNIIKPLTQVNKDLQQSKPTNLFAAILEIGDDQIDRADRMFHAEASRLVDNPTDYKFEIAHDQVQAIRLMHYETDDKKNLRNFIKRCRTFESAFSYLQGLAREEAREASQTTAASHTSRHDDDDSCRRHVPQQTHGSIINKTNPDFDDTSNPVCQNSSSDRSQGGSGATTVRRSANNSVLFNSSKSDIRDPKS